MGGDYEKEISDRKIYNPVCDWRNGIFFAGSFSTWIFTLFDVFMWWGMFPLLWASKRKCKDQDKFLYHLPYIRKEETLFRYR